MLDFVKKYGANIWSQNLEDGIINEIVSRLRLNRGTCVEFGAADGYYCSNTRRLIECGWGGYMYEDTGGNEEVEKKFITPKNVNELPKCNLLSIDIDGNDYEVWKAYKGKPEVVIIEINSSFAPDIYFFSEDMGCSYALMNKLGEEKGYFLVCHTGNMIFVDKKYKYRFPEITLDPIINHECFFNKSWLEFLDKC